jgi:hypothetical protein
MRLVTRAVTETTGLPNELWSIVAQCLFCMSPLDDRLCSCLFETRYLRTGHEYTHSWAARCAPGVVPSMIEADLACLGRITLRFHPMCKPHLFTEEQSVYPIELEANTSSRPVDNPTEVVFRFRLPDDDHKGDRAVRVQLDRVVHGAHGKFTLRIRHPNWDERFMLYSSPIICIDWSTGMPAFTDFIGPPSRAVPAPPSWPGSSKTSSRVCVAKVELECERCRYAKAGYPGNEFDETYPSWEPATKTLLHTVSLTFDTGPLN